MVWALGWIIPILVIAAVVYVVYLIVRPRREEGFNAHQALIAYFYFVTAASFITMAVGTVIFIQVAIRQAFNSVESIDDNLTLASVLLVTGLVICVLHVYGRRAVEKREEKVTTTIRRIYLFFMLGTFGLTALISLPLAIYQLLRYYIVGHRDETPATALAVAIVFVSLWAYFMFRVFWEMKVKSVN